MPNEDQLETFHCNSFASLNVSLWPIPWQLETEELHHFLHREETIFKRVKLCKSHGIISHHPSGGGGGGKECNTVAIIATDDSNEIFPTVNTIIV